MATPTLTLAADNREFPWKSRRSASGFVIERSGFVDTDDPGAALFAQGMPAIGDPYSAEIPSARFTGCEVEREGGMPRGDGTGGMCKVRLTWATPSFGSLRPAIPGDHWTEFQVQTASVLANFGIAGDPWQDRPVNNGDGVQVETGMACALVHTFYREDTATIDIARLLAMSTPNTVNDAPLLLPKLLNTETRLAIAAGQARYRTFTLGATDGVLEIVHHLALAPDHKYRWGEKSAEGQRVGNAEAAMYAPANMDGLWEPT